MTTELRHIKPIPTAQLPTRQLNTFQKQPLPNKRAKTQLGNDPGHLDGYIKRCLPEENQYKHSNGITAQRLQSRPEAINPFSTENTSNQLTFGAAKVCVATHNQVDIDFDSNFGPSMAESPTGTVNYIAFQRLTCTSRP